jgi:prefoldin beta subunit
MMKDKKATEEKIRQLQLAEQGMQALLTQKQALQMQLMEVESALKELETATEAYKIVGNIMVASEKPKLQQDLMEKKETVELRIKSIDGQESKTREKAEAIQKEVLEEIKNDDKNS